MSSRKKLYRKKKQCIIDDSDDDDFDLTPPPTSKRKSEKENLPAGSAKKKRASRTEKLDHKFQEQLNVALSASMKNDPDEVASAMDDKISDKNDPSFYSHQDDSISSGKSSDADSDFSPMSPKKSKKGKISLKKKRPLKQVLHSNSKKQLNERKKTMVQKPAVDNNTKIEIQECSVRVGPILPNNISTEKNHTDYSSKTDENSSVNNASLCTPKSIKTQNSKFSVTNKKAEKISMVSSPQLTAKWTPPGSSTCKRTPSLTYSSPNNGRLRLGLSRNHRSKPLHPNLSINAE